MVDTRSALQFLLIDGYEHPKELLIGIQPVSLLTHKVSNPHKQGYKAVGISSYKIKASISFYRFYTYFLDFFHFQLQFDQIIISLWFNALPICFFEIYFCASIVM